MKKIRNVFPNQKSLGEGILNKKEQTVGLQKFAKNKKQKKMLVSAIIGLILFVGCITLYRTFALYEEKKDFNVLRGRISNFSNSSDIKLAFTINGENQSDVLFPNKKDGYAVESVVCENGVTAEWNSSLWGLVNIQNENSKNIECMVNFVSTVILYNYVSVGDYIAYTPSNTNFNIPISITGNSTAQSINPSELNLWRVIRKNSNRTVEIVSENSSSAWIEFFGKAGYANLVNGLNTIAKSYETEGITVGSRHMGYNGQTLTCSPYNSGQCATGDTSYTTDINLVQSAIGSIATKYAYFLASRYYNYVDNHYYNFRSVEPNETITTSYLVAGEGEHAHGATIRPIVYLKSDILATKGTYNDRNLWTIN